MLEFTVPLVVTVQLGSVLSTHVAPGSIHGVPASIVCVVDPLSVITGLVLSTTITVLVTMFHGLPAVSV